VLAPKYGNRCWRSVRCNVLSDHVAVPSVRRSGARCAVATIRARSAAVYVRRRPRPGAIPSAASPCRLKRATRSATVVPLRRPAARAADRYAWPRATASSTVARRPRSTRSLVAAAIRSSAARSAAVMARKGSFCTGPISALLLRSIRYPPPPPPTICGVTH
jgi:hypothetical protein